MSDKVILLIEEDVILAENIAQILIGFCVMVATDNRMAQDLAGTIQPGLIICDNKTRDHDGCHLLKSLGTILNLSQIPIIVLTPFVESKPAIPNGDYLFVYFINKPFEPNDLLQAVQRHFP